MAKSLTRYFGSSAPGNKPTPRPLGLPHSTELTLSFDPNQTPSVWRDFRLFYDADVGINNELAANGDQEVVFQPARLRGPGTDVLQQEQAAGEARAEAYAKSNANADWHELRNQPIDVEDTSGTWRAGMEGLMLLAPTPLVVEAVATRVASAALQRSLRTVPTATKVAAREIPSLAERAAALVAKNGGRSRVSIKTAGGRMNVDLVGKAHNGVPTPHVQMYRNNIIPTGPRAGQVGSVSRVGPTRAATEAELRVVQRVLEAQP